MDLSRLLDHLAAEHVHVLLLTGAGLSDDQIAERLALPPEAVGPLRAIASAKVIHSGQSPGH